MKAIHIIITIISSVILFVIIFGAIKSHNPEDYWPMIIGLSVVVSAALVIGPKYVKSSDSENTHEN